MAGKKKRRPVEPAPRTVPIAVLTARGQAGLAAGWSLVLGGLIALAVQAIVGVRSTLGPHGVTYLTEPTLHSAPTWLTAVVLFAPLIGFNLVYWSASARGRTRQMTGVLVVLVLEMLLLMGATYWYAGADVVPSALFDPSATSADGTIAAHFFLAAVLSAAAIMRWLGGNSTFDAQHSEYFGSKGRTTVTTTPVGVRTHVLLTIGLLLLVFLALAPLIPSAHHTGIEQADFAARWPVMYEDDTYFVGALSFYVFATSVLFAVSASLLMKKMLYAGPWASRVARSPRKGRPGLLVRLAVRVQHAPVIIGVALATALFTVPDPDQYGYDFHPGYLVVAAVILVIATGLGVLCQAQVWKARDLRRPTLRLSRVDAVNV